MNSEYVKIYTNISYVYLFVIIYGDIFIHSIVREMMKELLRLRLEILRFRT